MDMSHEERVRKALVKMIIIDELPFSFVEKETFKRFVKATSGLNVPSQEKVSTECAQLFMDEKSKLKSLIKTSNQKVSLSLDTWTSNQSEDYLCITAHFIDDNWVLHKKIIGFTLVSSAEGEEIGKVVENCLRDWEIHSVMAISTTYASANDVAVSYLKKRFENTVLDAKFIHVKCGIAFINNLVKEVLTEHDDTITRVRDAVRSLGQSTTRIEKFKECVREYGIEYESFLCLDTPTRWNSTYKMLKTSQKFEEVFDLFAVRDPRYRKDLEETCGVPVHVDWENVRNVVTFLECFYGFAKRIFGLNATSAMYLSEIANIDSRLFSLANSDDIGTTNMALKLREVFNKYWENVENINMIIYVANVLDPRFKLKTIEYYFKKLYKQDNIYEAECMWKQMLQRVRASAFDLFNEYKRNIENQRQSEDSKSGNSVEYMSDFLRECDELSKKQKLDGEDDDTTEFDRYINEDCVKCDLVDSYDVLFWWKNNSARFPVLSKMAKDVLAVPMTAIAPESAFSTNGKLVDDFRSSLSPEILEGLVCTQDWLRGSKKEIEVEEDLLNLDNEDDVDEEEDSTSSGSFSSLDDVDEDEEDSISRGSISSVDDYDAEEDTTSSGSD